MRDFLEESVDEKYYIKNEKAQKLIKDLIANGTLRTEQNRTEQNRTEQNRTACSQLICVSSPDCSKSRLVSAQDTTQELKSTSSRQAAYLNYKRIEATNCNIAKTLCARDYKGFGTGFDTMNGVIEWQK